MNIIGLKSAARTLFRRCVQCPDNAPLCPLCTSDESCLYVPGTCDTCQSSVCQKIGGSKSSSSSNSSDHHSSSAAGPIAGGVIGGVVLIAVVTYLLWRFWIKKKRESFIPSEWNIDDLRSEKSPAQAQFAQNRGDRASTHTVGSIASTVLTRASNVIQIAYVPGVTTRSDSSPDLIPPVPPIPAFSPAHSASSTPQPGQGEHYFMPGDLRDSTYSGFTEGDNRTSYARSSMTPSMMRSSVATNAYRNNAVVNPVPAQIATRSKPGLVSVKSSGKNSPTETPNTPPPPMPANASSVSRNGPLQSSIVGRLGVPKTVNVTKSNNNLLATSQSQAGLANKPIISSNLSQSNSPVDPSPSLSDTSHTKLLQQYRPQGRTPSIHDGKSSTFDDGSSSEDDSPSDRSLMSSHQQQEQQQREHAAKMSAEIQAATRLGHSNFKSPSSAPDLRIGGASKPQDPKLAELSGSDPSTGYSSARDQRHKRSGSLNQIIEEATRRATREPRHGGLGSISQASELGVSARRPSKDKESPFSDENAAGTP